MSNFFDEYLYKKEEFDVLKKAYKGAFDIVGAQIEETARNTIISKTLAFKKIRFQMIDVNEASYTMSSLLNNNSVLAIMGLAPSTPYDKKLETWESLTPLEKADILDVTGYSILLTSYASLTEEDNYSPAKFNIIDFELSDINNNHYTRNVDYVFRDNKLFILKEFSVSDAYTKKSLILKNITIDTSSTEDILGVPLNIPYNDQFTKTEYNETLRSFIQAAAGGPTLGKLNVALDKYKTLQGVKVYDKYSSPPSKKSFWGFDGYIGVLTAFDFLVALPLGFAYNPEKLNYITRFFNQIKPAYTNFTFVPQMEVVDKLILKFHKDTMTIKPVFNIPDKINAKESKRFMAFKILSDGYTVTPYRYGDDAMLYTDRDAFTDRGVANDSIIVLALSRSIKDKLSAKDKLKQKPMLSKKEKIVVKKDSVDRFIKMSFSENYSIRQQAFADYNDFYDGNVLYDIFSFDDRYVRMNTALKLSDRGRYYDSAIKKPILAILDRLITRDKLRKDVHASIKDSFVYKKHNVLHDTNLSVKDRVRYKEKHNLLNRSNPCDRIVVRKDAPSYKQKNKCTDTMKLPKYTNTVYCDGVFSYDDVGGIFYDSREDSNTKARESVTMRLIPK